MNPKIRPSAVLRNIAILAAAFALCGSADASKLKVLYAFCSQVDCADGTNPGMPLTRDSAGNLYGATGTDPSTDGTIFQLRRKKSGWTLHTLYSFCEGCGRVLNSPLIVDVNGNLYGTSYQYSDQLGGEVFKLSPARGYSPWTYTVLYSFSGKRSGSEGALTYRGAASGLPYDGTSPLYGPSALGGDAAHGTVFSLTPKGERWNYRSIFSFCKHGKCLAGQGPYATLTMDGSGNLYGTTAAGGIKNEGVVFKLNATGKGKWSETVLHIFCSKDGCADGALPITNSVALAQDGTVFGTTYSGGAGSATCCGTAFTLAPDGTQTMLHGFSTESQGDGEFPIGGLIADESGHYLGITSLGGNTDNNPVGSGTIFALTNKYHLLYSFCAELCSDGAFPVGPLVGDGAGHYYGVTSRSGGRGYGTIFEFTP